MADPKGKNTVSYKFEGNEDDGVNENPIRDALVKLLFYRRLLKRNCVKNISLICEAVQRHCAAYKFSRIHEENELNVLLVCVVFRGILVHYASPASWIYSNIYPHPTPLPVEFVVQSASEFRRQTNSKINLFL